MRNVHNNDEGWSRWRGACSALPCFHLTCSFRRSSPSGVQAPSLLSSLLQEEAGVNEGKTPVKKKKRKKLPFNQRSDGLLSALGHRAHGFSIMLPAMPWFPVLYSHVFKFHVNLKNKKNDILLVAEKCQSLFVFLPWLFFHALMIYGFIL